MLKMTWKTVTGYQDKKPSTVDTTSSPTTVYIRRNIKRVLVTTDNGSAYVWQYEEAALTLDEYAEYEKLVAELETPAIQALQEEIFTLQTALADIYETIATQAATQEEINLAILEGLAEIYETQEGAAE